MAPGQWLGAFVARLVLVSWAPPEQWLGALSCHPEAKILAQAIAELSFVSGLGFVIMSSGCCRVAGGGRKSHLNEKNHQCCSPVVCFFAHLVCSLQGVLGVIPPPRRCPPLQFQVADVPFWGVSASQTTELHQCRLRPRGPGWGRW